MSGSLISATEHEFVANRTNFVVEELRRIERQCGWARVLAIAEVLSRYRYDDPAGVGKISLRALAQHPECPLSKSQLRDALEAARIYEEIEVVRSSNHITPSHTVPLSSLDAVTRRRLIVQTEAELLSVRELRTLVKETRLETGDCRGRPPKAASDKAITRCENAIMYLEEAVGLLEQAPASQQVRAQIAAQLVRQH